MGAAVVLPVAGTLSAIHHFGRDFANQTTHEAEVNDQISSEHEQLLYERVTKVEIRYCHLNGEIADFFTTLGARLSMLTFQAAHHHFLILTLKSGKLIYIDKHSKRNILLRPDKRGKNGPGNEWLSSECLRYCKPKVYNGHVMLYDVIRKIKYGGMFLDSHYHLIDNNCQHFAQCLYEWLLN